MLKLGDSNNGTPILQWTQSKIEQENKEDAEKIIHCWQS